VPSVLSDYVPSVSACVCLYSICKHFLYPLFSDTRNLYLPSFPLALQSYLFSIHGNVDSSLSGVSVTYVRPWGMI